MTLNMADSITPGNMQMGYPAYLGYVDGNWPTAVRLPQLFPGVKTVTLTVTGSTLSADGIDCEPGNVNAVKAAAWVVAKRAGGDPRPVVYADLASPGYSMTEVLAALAHMGVTREQVRLLTAHYDGEHICSPARGCKDANGNVIAFTADGTQWTSSFPGVGGAAIDMSVLADDFFAPAEPASAWVFGAVRGLTALPGHTSVLLSWSSPAQPEPAAVHNYQVTIRREGQDVASYPRDVPKGGNPQTWQGGSLAEGTQYEALVRAMTEDRTHGSPWAAVTFTTGHGG